jgi:hypothetical protein
MQRNGPICMRRAFQKSRKSRAKPPIRIGGLYPQDVGGSIPSSPTIPPLAVAANETRARA